jgi:hypothetical protein
MATSIERCCVAQVALSRHVLVYALLLTASCLKAHSSLNSQGINCAKVASSTLGALALLFAARERSSPASHERMSSTNTNRKDKPVLGIMLLLLLNVLITWGLLKK